MPSIHSLKAGYSTEKTFSPCIRQGPYLAEVSPLGERVHSELINSSKLLGDKYVFLCRATHSVLRTTANSVQYVESTPANQTMGSCASFVITKRSSSTQQWAKKGIGTGELE